MSKSVPHRKDVPEDHKWDAASVFPSDEAWNQAIEELIVRLAEFQKFQGRIKEGPQTLIQVLEKMQDLLQRVGRIRVYTSVYYLVDTTDPMRKGQRDRATGLVSQTASTIAFVDPELIAIGFPTLYQWLEKEPKLAVYRHKIHELERNQAHVRSSEVEQVMGMVIDAFTAATSTHGVLTDADFRFDPVRLKNGVEHEITQGTVNGLLSDGDREVRRLAWENYSDKHLASQNALANLVATGVKQNVFNARVRKYGSALEASMGVGNIPTTVFHQLIATCRKNYPVWHRYWKLRKQLLGYDKLHVYDFRAPLTSSKLEVPYRQSVDMVLEGLKPMGEEYVGIARRGLTTERWVDIYPNQGKLSGAFSSGKQGTHPFIFLNYNDDIYGTSILAHELGHSMHSYYTWKTQPTIYTDYGMFVAEVASNFNQALVRDYLFKSRSDRDFQTVMIEEAMDNFHRYFFIMPILAQFELEIHQRVERGEALTAKSLNELMCSLFQEGYGDEVVIDKERIGITWARFSVHLYSNFYVYQYATGIAGANALAEGVLAGKPKARENYISFLKAGNSMAPLDVLKMAGVDMTTSEPVDAAFRTLSQIVDRVEKLV